MPQPMPSFFMPTRRCLLASSLIMSACLFSTPMVEGAAHNYDHSRHLQDTTNSNVDCQAVTSRYSIQVIDMSPDPSQTDPRYAEAFDLAAARWSKVIVGDVPDFGANQVEDWFAGRFAPRSFNGAVDDLVIGYEIPATIDGRGGTLGSAGAVFIRRDRFNNPTSSASGTMQFDGLDLDTMDIEDVKSIILHEMGHVIGLVGTTGLCNQGCDPENPQQQSGYECDLANIEYEILADNIGTPSLFLENNGGRGTSCSHWDEVSFRQGESSELMTGFFEDNLFQPISRVTVAAVEDLGYEVDFCGADIWPATQDTIQKWKVYRSGGTIGDDVDTDRSSPKWNIDSETGETWEWGTSRDSGSGTVTTLYSLCVALGAASFFL